ncbi:MAG TPA: class I SAM-dependent methyltransferase [Gaiellaceae bacterium]|nr:class I SAM-dependent methyltransferase [Gaiellaceae bacterium]
MDPFELRRTSFGPAAELYDAIRPSYPPEAVRWMLGEAPLRVVDLGAGTGIFSRLVASFGHDVVAVEPDSGMRARLLAASPGVTPLAGSAEAVPLPDASVDAVVAAQAYHWFDNDAARLEITRLLKPRGVFAPIWNVRDESVDWVAELSTAAMLEGDGTTSQEYKEPEYEFGPLFLPAERAEFRHSTTHTTESLLELIHSRSLYLIADEAHRAQMDAGVRAVTRELPPTFELPYVAVAYRAISAV